MTPTFGLGGSIQVFDYFGDGAFRGWAARGGLALGRFVELGARLEHWPGLDTFSGSAVVAEGSLFPIGRKRVSPYFLLNLGHFWSTRPTFSGVSAAVGLGLDARLADPVSVRLEAVARYDVGGSDPALRGFVTYAPGLPHGGPPSKVEAALYGMMHVTGPWRFAEPAYALTLASQITPRNAAVLTFALLHMQSSEPTRKLVPYGWDTRAMLVSPAWRHRWQAGLLGWYAQAGPAFDLMPEGPDMGLRAGATADVGTVVWLGHLPALTGGIGWLWIVRGNSDPAVSPTNQCGLLFHAGVAF